MGTNTAVSKPDFGFVQKEYHNNHIAKTGSSKSKETTFDVIFAKQTNQDKKEVAVEKSQQKEPVLTKDTNVIKKAGNTSKSDQNQISKNTNSQLQEASSSMKEKLQDILDLSEEELNDLMEQMGITMFDLLDPSKLLKIVLAAGNEEDPGMLLTNETMGNQFKELMNCLEQIKDQYSFNTEDLKNLLDQMKEEVHSKFTSEEADNQAKEVEPEKKDVTMLQPVDQKDNSEVKHDEITVSVIKEDAEVSNGETDSKESSTDHMPDKKTDLSNQIIEHMANASNPANQVDFTSHLAQIHETRDMVSQIVEQIKVHIRPDQTSMEFTLNPESLGKVALNVTSRNGVLTASFLTQNQAAKEAIESQMQTLKDNLNEQGLKVDAIEVTVSEFGFSQDNQMQQSKDQKNQSSSKDKKVFRMDAGTNVIEDTIIEDSKSDTTIQMGSQIDYSA